jgi:hypothetical protein
MRKGIITVSALITAVIGLLNTAAAEGPSEADKQTATYLTMIADGRLQDVKAKLPDLMVERPNDPGVQLLLGVVIDDAFKALDIYKRITDNHPESEWADDAYWRIVQFYAVMGDTTKAKGELNNFRRRYPTSGYLVPAIDVVRSSIAMTRAEIKAVVEGPLLTPPIDMAASLKPLPDTKTKAKEQSVAAKVAIEPKVKETIPVPAEAITTKVDDKKPEIIAVKVEKNIEDQDDAADDLTEKTEIKPLQDKMPDSAEDEKDEMILIASTDSEPEIAKKPERVKTGYFGLQVAALSDMDGAEDMKAKYIQQRMRTEVIDLSSEGKPLYSVVIGNYSSKSSAEAARIIVARQCDCEPIIIEK